MDNTIAASHDERLQRTLTTPKLVFIIVAAAAPLAAMVFTVPLSFALGVGVGVPAMFVFAGLTLLCFTAGYIAISRRIVSAGGFYSYIARGLGRPPAISGGLIAIIAYNTVTVGVLGAFAYFARSIAASHGLHVPWELWAAVGIVIVGFLGYHHIEFSARVLSVFMICEVAILLALDLAVLVRRGAAALPPASFAPHNAFGPGVGVSMMFGFGSFIGFESAALYGEESRRPQRSVPLATFVAVLLVSSFYAFTSWVAAGAVGPAQVRSVSSRHLGDLFFVLTDRYLGSAATTAMQVLLCTSLFAGWLALHNAANRYMFVLGRERVLPRWLDAVHPRHSAVHRASLVQTMFSAVAVTSFAVAGLDPYTSMSTSMLGIGTLGIVALQAMACVSVLGFYRDRADRHWWTTTLAPILGTAGLITATVLILLNFDVLTGTTDPVVASLPWVVLAAGVGGIAYAYWLRSRRPERYARLAQLQVRRDSADAEEPATRQDAYLRSR